MKNIVTVKIGTKYSSNDVNKIFNLHKNYNFYCYTEDPKGLHKDIKIIEPLVIYEHAVFNKLSLFNPVHNITNVLYLDLDIIIQHSVEPLFRKPFTIGYAHWRDISYMDYETNRPFKRRTMLNSSVMSWSKQPLEIWEDFRDNTDQVLYWWGTAGIDPYIYKHLFEYEIYEKGLLTMEPDKNAIIMLGK